MQIRRERSDDYKWMIASLVAMLVGAAFIAVAMWPDEALLALTVWLMRAGLITMGIALFFSALGFFIYLCVIE